jgi:hypothetical protein
VVSQKSISVFFKRKYFALIAIVVLLIAAGLFANWQIKADTSDPLSQDKAYIALLRELNVSSQKNLDAIKQGSGLTTANLLNALEADRVPDTTKIGPIRGGAIQLLRDHPYESLSKTEQESVKLAATSQLEFRMSVNDNTISYINLQNGVKVPTLAELTAPGVAKTPTPQEIGEAKALENKDSQSQALPSAPGSVYVADDNSLQLKLPDRSSTTNEPVLVKVDAVDVAAQQAKSSNIIRAITTGSSIRAIQSNPVLYYNGANKAGAATVGYIADPYGDIITGTQPSAKSIERASQAVDFYLKQQQDILSANKELERIMKPKSPENYTVVKARNDATLATVVENGRLWVAIRDNLKNPGPRNSIDTSALAVVADPSSYIPSDPREVYVATYGKIASNLPTNALKDSVIKKAIENFPAPELSAPASTNSVPSATRSATDLAKSAPSSSSYSKGAITAAAVQAAGAAEPNASLPATLDTYKIGLRQAATGTMLGSGEFEKFYDSLKGNQIGRVNALAAGFEEVVLSGKAQLMQLSRNSGVEKYAIASGGDSIALSVRAKPLDQKLTDYGIFSDIYATETGKDPGEIIAIRNAAKKSASAGTASTVGDVVTAPAVQKQIDYIGRSSIGINPETGKVEYTTKVFDGDGVQAGWMSFDPLTQKYTSDLTTQYAGKFVRFYAAPRTGDTYVTISSSQNPQAPDAKALHKFGNLLEVTAVSVSADGHVGGTIKLFNRYFNYNPVTKAFEVKIKSLLGETSSVSKFMGNHNLDLTLDSRGTITGSYGILGKFDDVTGKFDSKSQMGLFFDSDGNAGATYAIRDGKSADSNVLGGVSVDLKGNIGGSINLGKIASSSGPNVFVSFDKQGISGINASVGSLSFLGKSTPIGIGLSRTGGLSVGISPFMLAGIPLPIGISLGGDAHGNLRLTLPFGSIGLGGSENRDLAPPEIQQTSDGAARLECIFFYHSIQKGILGTQIIRIWNTDPNNKCPLQIDPKEQIARSNKIFFIMNRLLGRNPTYQEFYSWYFYGAGDLAKPRQYQQDNYAAPANSDNRTIWLDTQMRQALMDTKEYKNKVAIAAGKPVVNSVTLSNAATTAQQQAQAVANGTPAATDIMAYNPFDPDQVAKYQAQQQAAAAATGATTAGSTTASGSTDTSLEPFFDAIEQAASQDPYFQDGVYVIPGTDTTSASTSVTAGASSTAVADESATSSTTAVSAADEESAVAENNALTDQNLIDHTITFKHGFSTIFVPRDEAGWDIKPFIDKELIVYDFNSDGSKTWKLSSKNEIPYLAPGIGYYVYNADAEDVSVITSAAGLSDVRPLRPGWNLLANSTSLYAKLTDLLYKVPKPDQPACAKASCMMQISLFDMFSKTVANSLAYKNLFLIKDSSATSAEDAFETIEVTNDNKDNLVFAPGETFWLYKWK